MGGVDSRRCNLGTLCSQNSYVIPLQGCNLRNNSSSSQLADKARSRTPIPLNGCDLREEQLIIIIIIIIIISIKFNADKARSSEWVNTIGRQQGAHPHGSGDGF